MKNNRSPLQQHWSEGGKIENRSVVKTIKTASLETRLWLQVTCLIMFLKSTTVQQCVRPLKYCAAGLSFSKTVVLSSLIQFQGTLQRGKPLTYRSYLGDYSPAKLQPFPLFLHLINTYIFFPNCFHCCKNTVIPLPIFKINKKVLWSATHHFLTTLPFFTIRCHYLNWGQGGIPGETESVKTV